ncbi:hypothetical protein [Bifidobacterium dentium]|uniref:hypothetical protein n=1 Tax=Bifidobacterium dentium TaxID=1689 RepID=UPI0018B08E5E|nr:hypothetical protein [Bifidobacterium dentium]MBF9670355.1 hypothetical protein [Bifidobacterium dentium]
MTDDATGTGETPRTRTFLLNLGAWPNNSYGTPLEKTKKRLLKRKWSLVPGESADGLEGRSYRFKKRSMHLYVHFLGFAVVTGPYVPVANVIEDCGKQWLGDTANPWREVGLSELDSSDWSGKIALAMMELMLDQLRCRAAGPVVVGGQVGDTDKLLHQCLRIHELFPPDDKRKYQKGLLEAKELMERIRRDSSMAFRSNMRIAVVEKLNKLFPSVIVFLAGLGVNEIGKDTFLAGLGINRTGIGWAFMVALILYLITCYALKLCDVTETPILPLPDESDDTED